MLGINEQDNTATAVTKLIVGCLLFTESIFLLIVLSEDHWTRKAAYCTLVHHNFLIILLSVTMLTSGFFYFAFDHTELKCLVFQVTRDLSENLVNWSMVVLAFCGLLLHETQGWLHDMVVKKRRLHVALLVCVWVVSVVLMVATYAEPKPFKDSSCGLLTFTPLILRTVSDVLSYVVVSVLMIVDFVRAWRCARLVITEQQDDSVQLTMARWTQLAGTLSIFCSLVVVLELGTIVSRLYHIIAPNSMGTHNVTPQLVVYVLCYLSQVLFFPLLLVRHDSLRHHLRRAIFHKCFVYQDETFSHNIECRYSQVESCRNFMSQPEGRMSVKRKREEYRNEAV